MGGVWQSHVPPIHTNKIASFLSLCYTCPRRNKRREPFIVASDTSNMQNPFIVGERIYLRPLEPAQDNHLYSTWINDEEIRRYFSIYPTSDSRGKERLEQLYKDGKHIIFGVALNCIQTLDMEENIAGWRTDEKAGFKYEGTMRESISRFGKYSDMRVYSILRSEYLQQESR